MIFAAVFVLGLVRVVLAVGLPLVLGFAVVTPLEYTLFVTVVFCEALVAVAVEVVAAVIPVVRAVGPYLDRLCALSAVTPATKTSHTPPTPSTHSSASSSSMR